MSVGAG